MINEQPQEQNTIDLALIPDQGEDEPEDNEINTTTPEDEQIQLDDISPSDHDNLNNQYDDNMDDNFEFDKILAHKHEDGVLVFKVQYQSDQGECILMTPFNLLK